MAIIDLLNCTQYMYSVVAFLCHPVHAPVMLQHFNICALVFGLEIHNVSMALGTSRSMFRKAWVCTLICLLLQGGYEADKGLAE